MENTTNPSWGRGFLLLCIFIVVFGIIVTSFRIVEIGSGGYIRSEALLDLLFSGVLLVIYLIGLLFAKGKLLRFALLSYAGFLIFAALISLQLATAKAGQIPSPSTEASLGLLFLVLGAVLGALSFVCFSYGIARFQSSDRIFLVVQVLLTLGLTWQRVRGSGLVPPPPGFGAEIVLPLVLIDFLGVAGLVSLALRPACWKAYPLITGCLTAGGIVSLSLDTGVFFFLPADLQTRLFHGVGIMSGTLFLLGVLLLIRSKRLEQATRQEQVSPGPLARE